MYLFQKIRPAFDDFCSFLGRKYLAYAYKEEKPKEDEDIKKHIRRENLELSNALAVLGIRPSTFNSLLVSEKKGEARKLLETALLERSEEKNEEELKSDIATDFEKTEVSKIHEAYQFVYKKYLEEDFQKEKFLSIEEIKRKNEERKKRKESETNDESELDQKAKERRSR